MTTQTKKSPGRPKKTQEKPKQVEVQPERLEKFKGTSIRGELDDAPIKKNFIVVPNIKQKDGNAQQTYMTCLSVEKCLNQW